jgi:hypothetical protein
LNHSAVPDHANLPAAEATCHQPSLQQVSADSSCAILAQLRTELGSFIRRLADLEGKLGN